MTDFSHQPDNNSIGDALDLTLGGDDDPGFSSPPEQHLPELGQIIYNTDLYKGHNLIPTMQINNAAVITPKSTKAQTHQFVRRPSDDDFAQMSKLSMCGGGFVIPRGSGGGSADPELKLPEIPEMPPGDFNQRQSDINDLLVAPVVLGRTQSERFPRGYRHHRARSPANGNQQPVTGNSNSNNGDDDISDFQSSGKIPARIPSFRIPSKLRVLPQGRSGRRHDRENDNGEKDTFVDETMWNDDQASATSTTPSTPEDAHMKGTWSFNTNEGLESTKPRSRASTLDRRQKQDTKVAIQVTAPEKKATNSNQLAPPSNRLLSSKRRSISDINIPISLQETLLQQAEAAAAVSAPRQSIHFDESKKSIGRWLAKMLLGAKGEPSCHRIRRISRDVVNDIMSYKGQAGEVMSHISQVLCVGEFGVGKHELVRNFRNIGATPNLPQFDDPLNDIISRGTSFSENSSSDEIDPAQLIAFEYNDNLIILDFSYADSEEDFVRHLIQKPPTLIVAVYSVCSPNSLDFCITAMDRLKNNGCEIPLALVGNKSDLVAARTVSKQESRAVAKQFGITLLEVSALLGEKCPELLLGILRQITLNQQQHQHENLSQQNSNGSTKSNTIWSRLSKTFSNNAK